MDKPDLKTVLPREIQSILDLSLPTWLTILVVGSILLWLGIKGLGALADALSKVRELLIKEGYLRARPDLLEEVQRNRQFCHVVTADINYLNKAEAWNDQNYAELEAEVEIEGGYFPSTLHRLLGRRTLGVRRAPRLLDALFTSTERRLLVVGEPGSGKSVALRHLAIQLAERANRKGGIGSPIPLYVNLRDLVPRVSDGEESLVPDVFRQFIIDSMRRGDPDTADYVMANWSKFAGRGDWILLLDSFDEIPAVMHAANESSAVETYSNALDRFLSSIPECRAVVASRIFKRPVGLTWPRLMVMALSQERQDLLIDNSFLPPALKTVVRRHLATLESTAFANPMLLTLLCRFVKDRSEVPLSDVTLLLDQVTRLSERDANHVQKTYGLSPERLLSSAKELARRLATSPALGLSPRLEELEDIRLGLSWEDIETTLSALVYVKILRADVPDARRGDRRFAFAHRRYHEALFVSEIVAGRVPLSVRELLSDQKWRDYAVTVLQSQIGAVFADILRELEALITEASGSLPQSSPHDVFGTSIVELAGSRLLDLLLLGQEGLSHRLSDTPNSLRQAVSVVVRAIWDSGDLVNRWRILGASGLADSDVLVPLIQESIEDAAPAL